MEKWEHDLRLGPIHVEGSDVFFLPIFQSAAPGVRNSKHSLEQAAAASVAAEATAVEKRKALAKQKAKEAKETATPIPTKEPAVPVSTAAAVSTPSATTAKKVSRVNLAKMLLF